MLKLQLAGATNPLLQRVSAGSSAPVPPSGVNPGTLTRPATPAETQRYYTEGWRGGDQGSGSPCRMGNVGGINVSRSCTGKADVLGFFQPSVEMTKTTSGKWNSSELAAVRAGTKDFGRQGDKQAWRVFFVNNGRTLRYEHKPRDFGGSVVGTLTSPLSYVGSKVLAPIAKAGQSLVNLACAASGNQTINASAGYAATQYGATYGQDAAARQANSLQAGAQFSAGAQAANTVCNIIGSKNTAGNPQAVQSQLVSYYRPSNKRWYTWSISGGGSLSGARICGAGQLCGPLAGTTLSELESKAAAIGASFVGTADNLPQGARNAGEIQESWYRSWWGLGLIAVGVGAVGYYGFKKRK